LITNVLATLFPPVLLFLLIPARHYRLRLNLSSSRVLLAPCYWNPLISWYTILFSFDLRIWQAFYMEKYLKENFVVDAKRPSDEALRRWRSAVSVVRNPRRRFRMVADLAKRAEAEKKRQNLQVRLYNACWSCFLWSRFTLSPFLLIFLISIKFLNK